MSLASVRSSNKAILSALQSPTAIFVGGTSGIGQAMAESFANHTDGQANIIIVGRNEAAANKILASFPKPAAPLKHEFIACDVTSMKAVGETTAAIKKSLSGPVDFLVLSPGWAAMEGRVETSEGLDRKMAVNYYGRWRFISDLVDRFNEKGAKVLSVLGAGYGAKADPNDWPMKKKYSVGNVAVITPTYNDLAMEKFAKLHPTHSFLHSTPGGVKTNYLSASKTWYIRYSGPILTTLLSPFLYSPEQCAENQWAGILNSGPGAHRIGSKGQDIGRKNWYGTDEEVESLWKHTKEVTSV
ncbi:NAD(P)-binding protein [Cylindrobasidium torrendii FP15055 ss-10]|uniref:NAD(P)-binding protein n=1 Tax=Cylindrobasidium torrendii FP15055 ss-10 TaxID=1314674 RepID=A0A0D7B7Q6_9AGAR|nr:NAD(P)-binding protein [Cylindrobasidium torrendii FP15055 ss-10]